MKGIKQNAREIAELKTAANIEKEAVDLRADIRDVIRRKLMLDIYKDKNWKDPSYVLEVLRTEGHIKSGAIIGRDAVQVVGSVRTEEKSKLKKRLAKCYDLYLTAPLAEFCWHMKTEKSETSVVDGGPELWEAGARWRFVLIELGGLGPNFWLEVDQVLARVEDSWKYYYEDVQKYGQAQPDDSRIVTSYPPSPSENDPANYQLPPETTGQLQQGLYAVDSHGPQAGGDNHDGTVSSNVI
ncbi:hypothetical protein MMC22_007591 [Lobaria immixta]|nr:hypothetical protein [Lobaria immixta]